MSTELHLLAAPGLLPWFEGIAICACMLFSFEQHLGNIGNAKVAVFVVNTEAGSCLASMSIPGMGVQWELPQYCSSCCRSLEVTSGSILIENDCHLQVKEKREAVRQLQERLQESHTASAGHTASIDSIQVCHLEEAGPCTSDAIITLHHYSISILPGQS